MYYVYINIESEIVYNVPGHPIWLATSMQSNSFSVIYFILFNILLDYDVEPQLNQLLAERFKRSRPAYRIAV